jgi:uncharacterized protein YjbJ (UPF0337 family)
MSTTAGSQQWNKIAANWTQYSAEVRRRWGLLTDYDLEEIRGERDMLINKLQERYGYTPEDAHQRVETWENTLSI